MTASALKRTVVQAARVDFVGIMENLADILNSIAQGKPRNIVDMKAGY